MFCLRSIFVAAAAFATVASAIPTAPSSIGDASTPNAERDLAKLLRTKWPVHGLAGDLDHHGFFDNLALVPARLPIKPSPGDILQTCSDGVELIIVKIDAAVNVDGGAKNVDCDLVISLLEGIVVLLRDALKDLKLITVAELTLKGVACTLVELAQVVAGLLILVIKIVYLVLSIVGFVNITLCGVIAIIGVLLCEILNVVLVLVSGLKVEVALLIKPLFDHCSFVHYQQLLLILGIQV